MERIETDVLVIGWGKAGKSLARALGSSGRSVVMVEQSDQMYGGTCINIACVPTKALVHQSELRRASDSAADWFTASVHTRDTLTAKLRARNHAMLTEVDTVTVVDGRARFVAPREVEVTAGQDRLRITGRTVVINTGTVPARPDLPGADGPRVYDSTTLQHVDPLPGHLVVVGGGFIGLEFAGMFARFGSRVTLLNSAARLVPGEDPDVAEALWFTVGNHEDYEALAGAEHGPDSTEVDFAVDYYGRVRCIRDAHVLSFPDGPRVAALWGIDDKARNHRTNVPRPGYITERSATHLAAQIRKTIDEALADRPRLQDNRVEAPKASDKESGNG